jgi:tetratricopeptide (TPR) repeat protein
MTAVTSTVAQHLLRHAEGRSTGVLTLARGQVRKQLFLRDGVLVSAESNLREEALGELLVALDLLPQHRLGALLGEVKRRGKKMGSVVIELGWVTPEGVFGALREQVRRRAQSCLRWSADDAVFEAGGAFVGSIIEHRFEVGTLVFSGLRESPSLELLEPALDQGQTPLVVLSPGLAPFRGEFEAVFGDEALRLLEPGRELGSLVLRPDAGELLYALEALLASGLARLGQLDELNQLDQLDQLNDVRRATSDAGGGVRLAELLKAEPRSAEGDGAFTAPATVQDIPLPPPPEEPALPPELMREYLSVHDANPHELLEVDLDASLEELDDALARKQARAAELAGGVRREELDELMSAYVLAHAVLRNPTRPDAKRPPELDEIPEGEAVKPAAVDPLGAEQAFREGRALVDAAQPRRALGPLRQAVQLRPDQAAYHAWLGATLYEVEGEAALPEAQDRLEHAVAVDPDSAEAHGLLGKLLVALREPARARGHLERALALRPEQAELIEQLALLYIDAEEPAQAERLYRRVLAALGERDLGLRRVLWRGLAELYEGPLADRPAAARAFAVAARLDPADHALQRKAASLLAVEV